jgi:hypothetical protein
MNNLEKCYVDVLSKIYSKFDINDKYADINIVKAT